MKQNIKIFATYKLYFLIEALVKDFSDNSNSIRMKVLVYTIRLSNILKLSHCQSIYVFQIQFFFLKTFKNAKTEKNKKRRCAPTIPYTAMSEGKCCRIVAGGRAATEAEITAGFLFSIL